MLWLYFVFFVVVAKCLISLYLERKEAQEMLRESARRIMEVTAMYQRHVQEKRKSSVNWKQEGF